MSANPSSVEGQNSSAQPSSGSPSPFEPGVFLPGGHNDDPPLPLSGPTAGYKLNHFMLRIRDPRRSLHFYKDLMGMRTVFTMNAGPFTLYYLGYPQTDEDKSNLPAWAAKTADTSVLTQTLGLLELYHVHGSERPDDQGGFDVSTGNQPPSLGFGHLGFTVPDVPAALERLRAANVPVVKDLGVSTRESIPLSEWEAARGVGLGDVHPNYSAVFSQIAFVSDPDGYIVELVPQHMK